MALNLPDLHVVCIDPPWPPAYGGAIDQYNSLLALSEAGYRPALHLFYRKDRLPLPPLPDELRLHSIHRYARPLSLHKGLGLRPFIVESRRQNALLNQLLRDEQPIFFHGIHTTGWAAHLRQQQADRRMALRVHNLESAYYKALAESETDLRRKLWFRAESLRLKHYERSTWPLFDRLMAISHVESARLAARGLSAEWLPAFIGPVDKPRAIHLLPERLGLLYHADFSVSVNRQAADFLLDVLPDLPVSVHLTLAGRGLGRWQSRYERPRCICVPDPEDMTPLIDAHPVVVLPIWRGAGVKIKLLESIRAGRIVLATPQALEGSGFEHAVARFTNRQELIQAVGQVLYHPETELQRAAANVHRLRQQHQPARLAASVAEALGLS